jgi:hypothetical protein
VANSDERLLAVLAALEECRSTLLACGGQDTAQLLSVAILDIRMKLNRISDADLKALCDAMCDGPAGRALDAKSAQPPQRRLRLVK